jgi:nucleotide-binding universal stress UspA family protein
MIRKILFPVDFSPACAAMAAYVRRAADMFGAQVTLIHVYDLQSHNGFELYVRPPAEIEEEHKEVAQQRLASFLASEFEARDCQRILCSGEAAEQIAEAARVGRFDLIVLPTHSGRFRRMLLGSTTAKVLNDADCPVMTTEHAETGAPRPLDHRVWACAIGLSDDSERVLRVAGEASAAVGAKLAVIHAAHKDVVDDAPRRVHDLLKIAGCDAKVHISAGPVKAALLEAATRLRADALIVGRKPGSGKFGRLRDLTYSLVRDSPVPVLSV